MCDEHLVVKVLCQGKRSALIVDQLLVSVSVSYLNLQSEPNSVTFRVFKVKINQHQQYNIDNVELELVNATDKNDRFSVPGRILDHSPEKQLSHVEWVEDLSYVILYCPFLGEILSLLWTHPGAGEHIHTQSSDFVRGPYTWGHTSTTRAVSSCSVSGPLLKGTSGDVGECCTTTPRPPYFLPTVWDSNRPPSGYRSTPPSRPVNIRQW